MNASENAKLNARASKKIARLDARMAAGKALTRQQEREYAEATSTWMATRPQRPAANA
jgi:hypothetical protein